MLAVLSAAAESAGSHWSRYKGLSPAVLSGGLPREHAVCAGNHSARAEGWPPAFQVQAPDFVSWDRFISFCLSELEVNSLGHFYGEKYHFPGAMPFPVLSLPKRDKHTNPNLTQKLLMFIKLRLILPSLSRKVVPTWDHHGCRSVPI